MCALNSETIVTSTSGGIRLILNGGSSIMEQATVPIQWFFSPEVMNKKPVRLLIIEQNQSEFDSADEGARYMVKVTDCIAFIQLFSPGKHHIAVVALNDKPYPNYLAREGKRQYVAEIPFRWIEDASQYGALWNRIVVGAAIAEIEVPRELFAHKNQTKFGELMWKWVNLWHELPPRDQCQYRTRMILAFTAQPALLAVWFVLRFCIQLSLTVLYPLTRLAAFFAGYKPNFIFKNTLNIWKWDTDEFGGDFSDTFLSDEVSGYRVWSVKGNRTRYMPITGIELSILAFVVWVGNLIIREITFRGVVAIGTIAIVTGIIMLAIYRIRRTTEDVEFKATRERESYEQWLRNLSLDQAPTKVDLKNLPVPYRGRFVLRFRVGFWNAKMKVCRPFATR